MKSGIVKGILLATALTGFAACSASQEPEGHSLQSSKTSARAIEITRATQGACILDAQLGLRVALAPAIVSALAPVIFDVSLNALEAGLREAGEAKEVTHQASVNIYPGRLPPECIHFAVGKFYTNADDYDPDRNYLAIPANVLARAVSRRNRTEVTGGSQLSPSELVKRVGIALGEAGLHFADEPGYFIETRIVRSSDGKAIALRPTYVLYRSLLGTNMFGNRNGTRDLTNLFAFHEPASRGSNVTATVAELTLPSLTTAPEGLLFRNSSKGSPLESSFVPYSSGFSNATVIDISITESRDANAFLIALADVVKQGGPALKDPVVQIVDKQKRETAEREAEASKITARTEAVAKISSAVSAYEQYRALSEDDPARRSKAVEVYPLMLNANVAATYADIPQPFSSSEVADVEAVALARRT